MIAVLFLAASPPHNLWQQVHESTDVAWLESFVLGGVPQSEHYGTAKLLPGIAYARLGAIGTPESLAAVHRIETAARLWKPAPPFRLGVQRHPGWHMGDITVNGDLRAEVGGITYAVYIDFVFGDMDLLLISSLHPEIADNWTPPHLIPLKIYRGMHDMKLRAGAGRTLVLSFIQDEPPQRRIMEGTTDRGETPPEFGPREVTISIDDVLRDSDHDGLTDYEEQRLGTDPHVADTDGDGIPDGADPAPDFAPGKRTAEDAVLEKAFFASYGLTGSTYTMFADSYRPPHPIQPWGFRGRLVYHAKGGTYGRIMVGWRIEDSTNHSATVRVWDGEGPLAGGETIVKLRWLNGEWYVVSVETGAIS